MTKEEIMNKLKGTLPVSTTGNGCRSYEVIENPSKEYHEKIEKYAFSNDDQFAFRGLSELFAEFMDKKSHESALCMKHTVAIGSVISPKSHQFTRMGFGFCREFFYKYNFNVAPYGIGLGTRRGWSEYAQKWPNGYSEEEVLKIVNDIISTLEEEVKLFSGSYFVKEKNENVTDALGRCFEEIAKEGN